MAPTADILTAASIALPTLAFIAVVLNVPPLVWHIRHRNVAACNLIGWAMFMNLCNFVNGLIWPTDNIYNWFSGQILCDIEVKLVLAAHFGVVGSLTCIMRALANVLDTQRTSLVPTKKHRRIEFIITSMLCFGGPLYAMAIHYVIQPSRYYILAVVGCTPSLDNSWPTIVLMDIWPVVFCLASTYYGASTSDLTKSRFLRLFLLASSLVLIFTPVQFYVFSLNLSTPLIPYSWDLVHDRHAWMDIIMLPLHGFVPVDRWISVVVGFFVFMFFGLGSDATRMYRKWWLKLRLGTGYGQRAAASAQTSQTGHEKGDNATTLSSPTRSSFDDAEKLSQIQRPTSITAPIHIIQSHSDLVQDRPLSPVPAESTPSSFKQYFTRVRDFAPPDDIELALQRHEGHRPNRFIAGLWHANNAGDPTSVPTLHAACSGTPNGLRF
ncbi:MAG: hypothetical protein Q9223_006888 [Gallowayella weberi]